MSETFKDYLTRMVKEREGFWEELSDEPKPIEIPVQQTLNITNLDALDKEFNTCIRGNQYVFKNKRDNLYFNTLYLNTT
jgi:hypothetical protein